jgi:hypothetical protein
LIRRTISAFEYRDQRPELVRAMVGTNVRARASLPILRARRRRDHLRRGHDQVRNVAYRQAVLRQLTRRLLPVLPLQRLARSPATDAPLVSRDELPADYTDFRAPIQPGYTGTIAPVVGRAGADRVWPLRPDTVALGKEATRT